jgi:hypothetical protein
MPPNILRQIVMKKNSFLTKCQQKKYYMSICQKIWKRIKFDTSL